jgi:hypothetical protein
MNPLKIKHWIGLRREPEEEAARSKPKKGFFGGAGKCGKT